MSPGRVPAGVVIERARGSAAAFHARAVPAPVVPALRLLEVDAPALVLGSTQRADDVADMATCRALGVDVVRRRSGGGAVLLDPGGALWFDVELPRGHPRWDDDVVRASWWLGERVAGALAPHLPPGADPVVHRGGLVRRPWSALVCFAGLGPGEVTAGAGGPKVLGISQRRTREGARFQCMVPLAWDAARLAALLALAPRERDRLASELAEAVLPVPVGASALAEAVVGAVGDALAVARRAAEP